jgi:predicted CopG family antitoxin
MATTNLHHITVDDEVYEKLRQLGQTSDSFNDVLHRVLDNVKFNRKEILA